MATTTAGWTTTTATSDRSDYVPNLDWLTPGRRDDGARDDGHSLKAGSESTSGRFIASHQSGVCNGP